MVDVLSILEEKDEQVDHIFITPPIAELDGDSDGDSGEEDGGGYIDNLGRNLLQADSIAILSNGKAIGEEDAENNTHETEPSQSVVSQKDRLQYKWTKKLIPLGGHIEKWQEYPPVVDMRGEDSPAKVFEFFFDDSLHSLIRKESIRYATQQGYCNFSVTVEEIKIVVGILLISGYHRLPSRNHYWSLKSDLMVDLMGHAMPRNRFDEVLRFLHIANSKRLDPNDRMGKLRPLMDHLQNAFQKAYIPEKHLSFDESMVAYYGRHGCKQFIRGKPIRFGFKNFCLCTPLGYLIAFDTYQGKTYQGKDYDNFGKGGGCLLNIIDNLQYGLNKLPTIFYCDNYFTGMPLIAEVSRRGQGLVGTIRDNRIPKSGILASTTAMKKASRGESSLVFDSANKMVLCRWKDNAVVTLASNVVADKPAQRANRWSVKDKKRITITQPMIVRDYNCYMGGVDRLDQNISCYRVSLREKKWWFSLLTWLLDVTVANSYYIFKQGHTDMNFLDFRREIVLFYLQGCQPIPPRPGPSRNRSDVATRVTQDVRFDGRGHYIVVNNCQRKCGKCSARPVTACIKCNVQLCAKCFLSFHSR